MVSFRSINIEQCQEKENVDNKDTLKRTKEFE